MKSLTKDKLEYLLKNIDWVRVELDEWSYDSNGYLVGSYDKISFNFVDNDYVSIEIDLHISKSEKCKKIEITLKDIWIGEELYQIEDEKQIKIITDEIIKNLDY